MKRILPIFYLMLLLFIVTACNRFPHLDDLPEKGSLSIIIVHERGDEKMENPKFLSEYMKHDVYRISHYNIDTIDNILPSLNIESAPYYIFLDSKGIAYETADIEDAEDFYKHNVNKRKDY